MFMGMPYGCNSVIPLSNIPCENPCGSTSPITLQQSCNNGAISPVIEPIQTNFVVKEQYVTVPHIKPVHTHVVNKIYYNHTYTPKYSCSESTEIDNNIIECCNKNMF